MGSISFKSVGKTREQQQIETLNTSLLPIGIKTPMRSDTKSGLIAMTYSLSDQVEDNFRNLLKTNWGERLVQYDFGANLSPLIINYHSDEDFQSQAIQSIANAVGKWMPYISLNDFSSENIGTTHDGFPQKILLNITYDIPALQVKNKAIQIVLTPS